MKTTSELKKTNEEYSTWFDTGWDNLCLSLEKGCEQPDFPRYRIKSMDLMVWQKKEDLAAWLRKCADIIDGAP